MHVHCDAEIPSHESDSESDSLSLTDPVVPCSMNLQPPSPTSRQIRNMTAAPWPAPAASPQLPTLSRPTSDAGPHELRTRRAHVSSWCFRANLCSRSCALRRCTCSCTGPTKVGACDCEFAHACMASVRSAHPSPVPAPVPTQGDIDRAAGGGVSTHRWWSGAEASARLSPPASSIAHPPTCPAKDQPRSSAMVASSSSSSSSPPAPTSIGSSPA